MSLARKLSDFFFTGATPGRLAATRWLLGVGLLPFFWMQYKSLLALDPFGPHWHYTDPVWYFAALGIRQHVPWLAIAGFGALLLALAAFAVGFRTRAAAWACLLLILLLKGARDSVAGDIHHRELIPFHVLLFFALSRSGDVASFDARRTASAARVSEWEASWPIHASQLYIASFYLWSGLAKLRVSGTAWLGGGDFKSFSSRARSVSAWTGLPSGAASASGSRITPRPSPSSRWA